MEENTILEKIEADFKEGSLHKLIYKYLIKHKWVLDYIEAKKIFTINKLYLFIKGTGENNIHRDTLSSYLETLYSSNYLKLDIIPTRLKSANLYYTLNCPDNLITDRTNVLIRINEKPVEPKPALKDIWRKQSNEAKELREEKKRPSMEELENEERRIEVNNQKLIEAREYNKKKTRVKNGVVGQ